MDSTKFIIEQITRINNSGSNSKLSELLQDISSSINIEEEIEIEDDNNKSFDTREVNLTTVVKEIKDMGVHCCFTTKDGRQMEGNISSYFADPDLLPIFQFTARKTETVERLCGTVVKATYIDKTPIAQPMTVSIWKTICRKFISESIVLQNLLPDHMIINYNQAIATLPNDLDKDIVLDTLINRKQFIKYYILHKHIKEITDAYPNSMGIIMTKMTRSEIVSLAQDILRKPVALCFYKTKTNKYLPELNLVKFISIMNRLDKMTVSNRELYGDLQIPIYLRMAVYIYNFIKIECIPSFSDYISKLKKPSTNCHYDGHLMRPIEKWPEPSQTGHMYVREDYIYSTMISIYYSDYLDRTSETIKQALEWLYDKKIIIKSHTVISKKKHSILYLEHIYNEQENVVSVIESLTVKRETMVSNDTIVENFSIDSQYRKRSTVKQAGVIVSQQRDIPIDCPLLVDPKCRKTINKLIFNDDVTIGLSEEDMKTHKMIHDAISLYNYTEDLKLEPTKVFPAYHCPISHRSCCRVTLEEAELIYLALNNEELNAEQRLSLLRIAHNAVSTISGMGGTGKTTLMSYVRSVFSKVKDYDPLEIYDECIAATIAGRASEILIEKGIPSATFASYLASHDGYILNVHRTLDSFEWTPEQEQTMTMNDKISFIEQNMMRHKMYRVRVLLLDEASMINISYLEKLLRLLLGYGKLIKVILVGDLFQLPPISGGRPFEDIADGVSISSTELRRNMRNKTRILFDNAEKVRHRNTNLEYDNELFTFTNCGRTDPGIIVSKFIIDHDIINADSGWSDFHCLSTRREDAETKINNACYELFCSLHPDRRLFEKETSADGSVRYSTKIFPCGIKIYVTKNIKQRSHGIQNGLIFTITAYIDAHPEYDIKKFNWLKKWTDKTCLPTRWVPSHTEPILYAQHNIKPHPVVRFAVCQKMSNRKLFLLPITGKYGVSLSSSLFQLGYGNTICKFQGSQIPHGLTYIRFIPGVTNYRLFYTAITRPEEANHLFAPSIDDINKCIQTDYIDRRSDMGRLIRDRLSKSCKIISVSKAIDIGKKLDIEGGVQEYIRKTIDNVDNKIKELSSSTDDNNDLLNSELSNHMVENPTFYDTIFTIRSNNMIQSTDSMDYLSRSSSSICISSENSMESMRSKTPLLCDIENGDVSVEDMLHNIKTHKVARNNNNKMDINYSNEAYVRNCVTILERTRKEVKPSDSFIVSLNNNRYRDNKYKLHYGRKFVNNINRIIMMKDDTYFKQKIVQEIFNMFKDNQ